MNKEREINDTPNDTINPDFVRINKLEEIVEHWEEHYRRQKIDYGNEITAPNFALDKCLNEINYEKDLEKYTTEEIKDALCGHFYHDDIIIFLLKPYMENL